MGGGNTPGGGPGDGSDVSSQRLVVKADGTAIGYAQLVGEHTVFVFDPNRKILFTVNDTTGHVTGRHRPDPNPDLDEYTLYQGEECRGGSVRYNDLVVAEDRELSSGIRCEPDYYTTRERRTVSAVNGDPHGRTPGTAVSYAKSVEWLVASAQFGADTPCQAANPATQQCVVERRVTDIIPVTFPLPITLHAGEVIDEDPVVRIEAR